MSHEVDQRSAEEQLAEILATRKKNKERQQKHRDKKCALELSAEEKAYQASPQEIWHENLTLLENEHPTEFAQVQEIQAEYERIQQAMRGVVDAVPEAHQPALLKRKSVVVEDPIQIWQSLKLFEAKNYLGSKFKLELGPEVEPAPAPGSEFCNCDAFGEAGTSKDVWSCFGIYLGFDSSLKRAFTRAGIYHLLIEGTSDQETLRQMVEEHMEDARRSPEGLEHYPFRASGEEAIYAFLGLRMRAFLAGEPFVPPSVEQPKRKPQPVIIQLPDARGVSFAIGTENLR